MKLHLIAGARPNFMKIAPLWRGLQSHRRIRPVFVHMGQHRDDAMSGAILNDLRLPEPDHFLVWQKTPDGDSVGPMMAAYETLCTRDRPDVVLVVGDVNASLAAAQVAHRLSVPLVHLEAGLRCFDRAMVEERNRVKIDQLADLLLTPCEDANENLRREGIASDRIVHVGNVMIDCYEMLRDDIWQNDILGQLSVLPRRYGVLTLHRAENIDDPARLGRILDVLVDLGRDHPVCFPAHPRTAQKINHTGCLTDLIKTGIRILPPLSYIPFVRLIGDAGFVVTDSGGVQDETTHLGVECLTLRPNTERPTTINHGTNRLADLDHLCEQVRGLTRSKTKPIPYWDGRAAGRTIQAIERFF
ncbi:UDP-N-acetylglucosamine 2-epimerase (non-hydrolyzing) [Thalassospira sp. MA62]|nr:UDP-N-acetylglucosamine 2-epimerase (non-hydrolyzing) [Thalassospira sp. MA62]